jgi:hypothetical protein
VKSEGPEKVTDAFSNFFLKISESLNVHQVGREDEI